MAESQKPNIAKLLDDARKGKEAAWDELIRLFGNDIERFLRKSFPRLLEEHVDIAQETFLIFVKTGIRNLQGTDQRSVASYLISIARNVALQVINNLNPAPAADPIDSERTSAPSIDDLQVTSDPTRNTAELSEARDHLRHCLGELSLNHQKVIVMHYLRGLGIKEIEAILREPYGTVGRWLSEGRQHLRECMQRVGVSGDWFLE